MLAAGTAGLGRTSETIGREVYEEAARLRLATDCTALVRAIEDLDATEKAVAELGDEVRRLEPQAFIAKVEAVAMESGGGDGLSTAAHGLEIRERWHSLSAWRGAQKLLAALAEDATSGERKLAKRLGLTRPEVRTRKEKLRQVGFLEGVRTPTDDGREAVELAQRHPTEAVDQE